MKFVTIRGKSIGHVVFDGSKSFYVINDVGLYPNGYYLLLKSEGDKYLVVRQFGCRYPFNYGQQRNWIDFLKSRNYNILAKREFNNLCNNTDKF